MDEYYTPPTNNPGNSMPPQQDAHDLAVLVLIMGIISVACCNYYLSGVVALVVYLTSKKKFIEPSSQKMAKAGFICSIVGLSLWALLIIGYILFLIFSVFLSLL